MPSEPRTIWAAAQSALVGALVQGRQLPSKFDEKDVASAARSLLMKRFRQVQLAWPVFDQTLKESFLPLFIDFAPTSNLPVEAQGRQDGWQFAHWLMKRNQLPDLARLALLQIELAGVIQPRRGLAIKMAWLRERGRLAIGLKVPGCRSWILPGQ